MRRTPSDGPRGTTAAIAAILLAIITAAPEAAAAAAAATPAAAPAAAAASAVHVSGTGARLRRTRRGWASTEISSRSNMLLVAAARESVLLAAATSAVATMAGREEPRLVFIAREIIAVTFVSQGETYDYAKRYLLEA